MKSKSKYVSALPKILNGPSLLTWQSAISSIIFGPFRLLGNTHLFSWLFRWPVGVDMYCRSCRPKVRIWRRVCEKFDEFPICWKRSKFERCWMRMRTSSHPYSFLPQSEIVWDWKGWNGSIVTMQYRCILLCDRCRFNTLMQWRPITTHQPTSHGLLPRAKLMSTQRQRNQRRPEELAWVPLTFDSYCTFWTSRNLVCQNVVFCQIAALNH